MSNSSMPNNFLPKAIENVKKALAADTAENYPEAFRLYSLALEYFMTALKYEGNEKTKQTIRAKTGEYMARAERIKEILDSGQKPTNESGGGGSARCLLLRMLMLDLICTSKKKGDMNDKDADENEKMRGNMQNSVLSDNIPKVHWDDVAGLHGAKEALKEAVILPNRFPHMFVGKREPWKGILLYGPPGTGKSYLAQAVATEGECTFFSVSSADLVSKWLGESEKYTLVVLEYTKAIDRGCILALTRARQVRTLFELARENKPSVIFIDEIDSLAGARGDGDSESGTGLIASLTGHQKIGFDLFEGTRIKTEFLVQMNGLGNDMNGVLVLAATNMPWSLDSAIRRRFEKRVYIPLPTASARAQMFKIHLGDTPHTLTQEDFRRLGEMSEGYSGSDIKTCVREALMMPVRIVQNATHYKKVIAPDRNDPSKMREYLTPCSPGDPEGIEKTWMDLKGDELLEPALTASHFRASVRNTRPSVGESDIAEHIKWTQEYGQEG